MIRFLQPHADICSVTASLFTARNDHRAKKIAVLALLSASAVLLVVSMVDFVAGHPFKMFAGFHEPFGSYSHAFILPGLLVTTAIVVCRMPARSSTHWIPALSLTSSWVVTLFAGLAKETTLGAQVFYLLPIVFGAHLLRGPALAIMTVNTLLAQTVQLVWVHGTNLRVAEIVVLAFVAPTAVFLMQRAKTTQEELLEHLEDSAMRDSLTSLWRRTKLDQAMKELADKHHYSLVVLDVDHFKTTNDRFGHLAGDEVLIRLADILQASCGPGDVACRLGGDEFAVLYLGANPTTAQDRAKAVAQQAQHAKLRAAGRTVPLASLSIGVASTEVSGSSPSVLYHDADAALYHAKAAGRGQVQHWQDTNQSGHTAQGPRQCTAPVQPTNKGDCETGTSSR